MRDSRLLRRRAMGERRLQDRCLICRGRKGSSSRVLDLNFSVTVSWILAYSKHVGVDVVEGKRFRTEMRLIAWNMASCCLQSSNGLKSIEQIVSAIYQWF
jgi:hypothetical protein